MHCIALPAVINPACSSEKVNTSLSALQKCFNIIVVFECLGKDILGNPGVTHSIPTTHHECSGYGMGHTWFTKDGGKMISVRRHY